MGLDRRTTRLPADLPVGQISRLVRRRPVARMERSAIRESLVAAPDFAEPVLGRAFARPVGSIRATLTLSPSLRGAPRRSNPYRITRSLSSRARAAHSLIRRKGGASEEDFNGRTKYNDQIAVCCHRLSKQKGHTNETYDNSNRRCARALQHGRTGTDRLQRCGVFDP